MLNQAAWRRGWELLALVILMVACRERPVHAEQTTFVFGSPTMDRWNYPFAGSPGGNPYAAVFSPLTAAGFDPSFDNRDGQMVIAFDTSSQIAPQPGPGRYRVVEASVWLTVETGNAFSYDPTPDSFRCWLPANDPLYLADADAGHAVELFGTGYRHGYSASTYTENVAYSPIGAFGKGVRSGYPIAFNAAGACVDISNNVDQRFDPDPFAVGKSGGLASGQPVPADSVLRFELDVADADVQRYLRTGLDQGTLSFSVASVFPSQQQTSGTYPRFYTKEHLSVQFGLVSAARMEVSVEVLSTPTPDGDTNFDGLVNIDDLIKVITQWGSCPCCAADLNRDNTVNIDDLLMVINTWQ